MPPTLQQVRDRWLDGDPIREPDAIKASAIPAALVTNAPEWDSFLRHLQAKLNEAEAAANAWKERAVTSYHEHERLQAQCSFYSCQARVETLREIMGLPKQLQETHGGSGPTSSE